MKFNMNLLIASLIASIESYLLAVSGGYTVPFVVLISLAIVALALERAVVAAGNDLVACLRTCLRGFVWVSISAAIFAASALVVATSACVTAMPLSPHAPCHEQQGGGNDDDDNGSLHNIDNLCDETCDLVE